MVITRIQVIANGTVPASEVDEIVNEIKWEIKKNYVLKNDLTIIDILSANDWERPIYFASTTGLDAYIGLEDYFRAEGMTYRLVPVKPFFVECNHYPPSVSRGVPRVWRKKTWDPSCVSSTEV